ncbi:N-acetyltransferase B complex non catalytic subunit-domain-containing protein [Cokeromyces recurvatus]|uniref:N-acetyltransferase B complex non catalytic subunit-domain-containing protein n=1 Tax=Cokeromyces recurvatus TaxID=90255 RepID=UPI0022205716|nr:N-acetyltransferase B complex non catalytic subunit-domain-containing protein [Cokeromyces recurvatus]KAI7906285.1 N-acetyltransferase B complex non catalytic subunit-domain-containing protein [Cokeromyces recurvatus]
MDYTTEKKLRPLYEALDEGQNKIALQHCAKLLKKNPDWPLVKALKALALVRTGKEEESFELCGQVKKAIPTDEPTLLAVTMALKELGKHSVIVELYENASNQQPKNEEFANHWFMAMVRNNDFKGQQAAAVKLHRLFKQNKYLFWAIMSLALQGTPLAYVLAERMMGKALEENRLQEVEHMRLYLLILMDQQKNEQALQLLLANDELAQKSLRDPEIRQIKSELLRANQRWQETLEMSQAILDGENADDWFHWLAYFDAIDALNDTEMINKAMALVERLQQAALKAKVLKRGPFLAELELDHRLWKTGKREEDVILEHTAKYFERFGSKNCAFEDLHSYIGFLKGEKAKAWIDRLKETIQPAKDKAANIKNVHKQVNIRKLERFLGLHSAVDVKEALEIVNTLWCEYQNALPLGEGLEKTEMQYGDEFAILASHLLVDLYHQYKESSYLIQAISLLELALTKSIYNFQIKLILVRMYTLLGVYQRPFEIYRTMEIKQIQFDTMIHYFTDRFACLGCFDQLEDMLHESLLIYKSNEVETPEMLVKAYQYGTFSKIQEFIEFRRRLDTSLQHAITQIELIRLNYIHSSFQTKYAVQFFQEQDVSQLTCDSSVTYSDNRDFRVFLNYNGQEKPNIEEYCKPLNMSTSQEWVQVMSYILHIMSVICETKDSARDLSHLSKGLKDLLECENVKKQITHNEFWLACYVSELTQALVLLKKSEDGSSQLKNATTILEDQLSKVDAFSEKTLSWNTFHQLSTSLEAFNYGTVLIEIINRTLGLNSKEARRKAAEKAGSDPFMASFVQLQEASKKSLREIQTIARNGKELFRAQLQRKLCKEVLESENVVSYLKENQNLIQEHVKIMIQSWSLSCTQFSEEIDRRVQKL